MTPRQKPDLDRLEFPCHLADLVGMNPVELGALKKLGCPFFGKKTTLRWVRSFLAQMSGAKAVVAARRAEEAEAASLRSVRPRHSALSKHGAPCGSNGSPGASLRVRRAQICGTSR